MSLNEHKPESLNGSVASRTTEVVASKTYKPSDTSLYIDVPVFSLKNVVWGDASSGNSLTYKLQHVDSTSGVVLSSVTQTWDGNNGNGSYAASPAFGIYIESGTEVYAEIFADTTGNSAFTIDYDAAAIGFTTREVQ